MTLTEALKQGDIVRRKSWPWWKVYNNVNHDSKRIWLVTDTPRHNGWVDKISYADAIAEDWEVKDRIP